MVPLQFPSIGIKTRCALPAAAKTEYLSRFSAQQTPIILDAHMEDDTESQSLLQSVLGLFARKPPQRPAEAASLRSRKYEAWLRTDAFLQRDDLGEADPESVARTLRAFEHLVQDDSNREIDFVGVLDIQ